LGKKPGHATEEVFEQLAAPAAHLFLLFFFLRTLNCTLISHHLLCALLPLLQMLWTGSMVAVAAATRRIVCGVRSPINARDSPLLNKLTV
jgi:hypothetical protein